MRAPVSHENVGRRAVRVVYLSRNDGTDMRVSKECNSLLRAGYDVHFVGWRAQTSAERPDPMPDVPKHVYAVQELSGTTDKLLQFPGYVRHVARTLRTLQPDVVHCVNEDLGFLAMLLQPFHGYRLVCDLFDSIGLQWGSKRFPAGALARSVAKVVHARSDLLIVTDEVRRKRLGPLAAKARTVGNYPVDVSAEVAFELPEADGPIRLYVAGSLSKMRGLDDVLQLAEQRGDLQIISAGWVYDEAAQRFVQHPAVDYRGVITPGDSLRLAATCHAIVSLYAPVTENNRLASPNKIYDALCIGRPVIINREANVSAWVETRQVGYVVGYGDLAELNTALDALNRDRRHMERVAQRLRRLYEQGYSWSVAEEAMLAAYATLRGENGQEQDHAD